MAYSLSFLIFFLGLSLVLCQKISIENIVGEVEYSSEVVNGESVINIPIPKLKGVNNLSPKINIQYKSTQYLQNKEIGLGWQLDGLSDISRCYKTNAHDGQHDNVKFKYSDRFCMDGQRLVLLSGIYGTNNSEYRTEIESFKKIIALGIQGQGPSMFKVYTKDNLIYTYGDTDSSKLVPFGQFSVSKWYLSKIEDNLGNSISYVYLNNNNRYCYLQTILYANRNITFNYIDRTDVQTKYYSNRIDYSINRLLKSVVLYVNTRNTSSSEIKRLDFDYQLYGPAQLNILKRVRLCFPDSSCTRPLIFSYDGESGVNEKFDKINYQQYVCGVKDKLCELRQMVDMNADGKADIVGFGNSGIYVSLNNGNGFGPATIWSSELCENTGWVNS